MKAVLFDLDGTLIDTVPLYEEATRQALALGSHELTGEQFCALYSQDARLGTWLDTLGVNRALESVIRDKRREVYVQLLRDRTEWLLEAEEALTLLQQFFRLGVVTGARREHVEIVEAKLKLRRYMEVVLTHEDVGGIRKPHPHGLLMASAALSLKPSECAYIGDQPYDLEAAEAAGMQGYLCLSQTTGAPTPQEKYQDRIVASVLEVAKMLRDGRV